MTSKTPGQRAYERELKREPAYHWGAPRPAWENLPEIARWSWERGNEPCAIECNTAARRVHSIL